MKKLSSLLCGLAVLGMMFTSCNPDDDNKKPIENIVEDGFYVVGEATAFANLQTEGSAASIMAAGTNENASNAAREGMYEKYIALEGGKPFQLVLKEGSIETVYGAELAEVALSGNDQPAITVQRGKMVENATMQVKESGLYHIVLDLNLDNKLEDKLILVAPVEWGVRGGMNGWGFTAGERSEFNKTTMTYTWKDQSLSAGGEFKFAYGAGWKIELNALADATDANDARYIKANTNLGADALPGGANIKVEKAGTYEITLIYTLAQGAIANSYKYDVKLTAESALPSEMYMIGDAIGGWDWAANGLAMVPVHSAEGAFWLIRHLEAGKPFKFCPVKEWNGDFTGLGEDKGYVVADGNCSVETTGTYMIYVDVKNKKLVIEPVAVYGIGDCFGGWDAKMEAAKFVVAEDGTLSVTVAKDGNLRIYAESSVATTDWWTREFNVFEGKIEYRGAGNDQAAVAATAEQVVTLDFNAGTGSIK